MLPDILLVHPQHPGNIGFCCRAMKTMGFDRLVIIAEKPVDFAAAAITAVDAADVLHSARVADRFEAVLSDYHFLVAVTARTRRFRNSISLPQLPDLLKAQPLQCRAGLVFGRESSGLTNEEIACCQASVSIPTAKALRSLNLSHAVQVACYEVLRGGLVPDLASLSRPKAVRMATAMEREAIFIKLEKVTDAIGLNPCDREKLEKCFRILFEEKPMQKREAGAMHRFLDQIIYGKHKNETFRA